MSDDRSNPDDLTPMNEERPSRLGTTALCEADAQALDALLAARAVDDSSSALGPESGALGPEVRAAGPMPPGSAERTKRLSALLALLGQYDQSLARQSSHHGEHAEHGEQVGLHAAASETWPSNRIGSAGLHVPGASSEFAKSNRSDAAEGGNALKRSTASNTSSESSASALDSPSGDDPDEALIQRTLSRVHDQRQRQRFARQVSQLTEVRPGMGVSWRQVLTAAAMFIVGISLLMPVLHNNQAAARQTACAANLGSAGIGFVGYANDHQGKLPRYDNLSQDHGWWRVGAKHKAGSPPTSNSANLYRLARQNYVSPGLLICPANPDAPAKGKLTASAYDFPNYQSLSYSYQNQFRAKAVVLNANPALALLADRNPLFEVSTDRFARRQNVASTAPSTLHGRRGQNVLKADQSVIWTIRPTIPRSNRPEADNLWTLAGVTRYTGSERPSDVDENFLAP